MIKTALIYALAVIGGAAVIGAVVVLAMAVALEMRERRRPKRKFCIMMDRECYEPTTTKCSACIKRIREDEEKQRDFSES